MKFILLLFFPCVGFSLLRNFFSLYNKFYHYFQKSKKDIYPIANVPVQDDKKLIILTPAGMYGFYVLGVASYLKQHYDLSDYIFSGASAGAWNSLFLTYNGQHTDEMYKNLFTCVSNSSNIYQMELNMKNFMLNEFRHDDFELDRLNVGVAALKRFHFKLYIYNDFDSLEDALDSCIASSHIPFISGGLYAKYRNRWSYDGGFYSYPYVKNIIPSFIIHPSMWNSTHTIADFPISTLINFKRKPLNISELFTLGYNDTHNNKAILDQVFTSL